MQFIDPASGAITLLAAPAQHDPRCFRFNDAKVDPAGRFWAGTLALDGRTGESRLYRIDNDGNVQVMREGVAIEMTKHVGAPPAAHLHAQFGDQGLVQFQHQRQVGRGRASPGDLADDRHVGVRIYRVHGAEGAMVESALPVQSRRMAAGLESGGVEGFMGAYDPPDDPKWRETALKFTRQRLEDEVMSRALHGCVELIVRDGQVWGERHRFDNQHSMALLAWLDRKAAVTDDENGTTRDVAERFDEFVLEDLFAAGIVPPLISAG